ncbi:MAG TPA: DUF4845 domain-containing protein [Pseudomonadales bacterium]|nr:DUF4845 domain-containing protein [Pseudomonadales bacterium]
MLTRKHQRGFGALEWMVILFVGGVLLSTGIKLVPIYIDNMAIQDAFKALYSVEEPVKRKPSAGDIASQISRKLRTNNINYLSKDNVSVDYSDNDEMIINLDYEVRIGIVGNIDAVVKFTHDFSYPKG